MNGKKVSAALSGLPDDMVAEAMEPGRSRRGFSWLRLAACVAIVVGLCFGYWPTQPEIVTAPGLLTVTVYAKEPDGHGYVVTEFNGAISAATKQEKECIIDGELLDPIGVSVYFMIESDEFPTEQIYFKVKYDRGVYFDYSSGDYVRRLAREFRRMNPSFASWHPMYSLDDDPNAQNNPAYDHVYTEIIIYCDDHIIGYALMRFDRIHGDFRPLTMYAPVMVESILFPKRNGEFQKITEDYVVDCISAAEMNDFASLEETIDTNEQD